MKGCLTKMNEEKDLGELVKQNLRWSYFHQFLREAVPNYSKPILSSSYYEIGHWVQSLIIEISRCRFIFKESTKENKKLSHSLEA